MKKAIVTIKMIFCIMTIFLYSCEKTGIQSGAVIESFDKFSVKNNRLVFKDEETFRSVLTDLKKIYTQEQLAKWEEKYNYTSLRKYNSLNLENQHLQDMNLPMSYTVLLNSEGEVVIGNTLIWFNNGYNYFIPLQEESKITLIKKKPDMIKEKAEVMTDLKVNDDTDLKQVMTILDPGDSDARHQHEWNLNGDTYSKRKTVYELTAYCIRMGWFNPSYDSGLNVKIKLEWYSYNNGWQSGASEFRDANFSIRGTVGYSLPSLGGSMIFRNVIADWNRPGDYWHFTSNVDQEVNILSVNERITEFQCYLTGTIYSHVIANGVFQNGSPFTASGNLWQ